MMRHRTRLVVWSGMLALALAGGAVAQERGPRTDPASSIGYDLILTQPQAPLVRLAVDEGANPPRLLGIGPRGEVWGINIFIGAPVLERLPKDKAPPPPSLTITKASTGAVEAVRYTHPVTENRAVLGWRTLQVRRRGGEILEYHLPEGERFAVPKPVLIDLKQDGLQEVLTVRRDAAGNSRMVVFSPAPGKLAPVAETPAAPDGETLDPIGMADVEGKGQEQIALVSNPEGDGYLETFAFENAKLVRKWRLYGYNSLLPGTGRGAVAVLLDFNRDGVTDLLLPRNDRLGLAVVTMAGGYSRPLWQTTVTSPLASAFTVLPDGVGGVREIAFLLADGRLGVLERRVTGGILRGGRPQ